MKFRKRFYAQIQNFFQGEKKGPRDIKVCQEWGGDGGGGVPGVRAINLVILLCNLRNLSFAGVGGGGRLQLIYITKTFKLWVSFIT